MSLDPITADFRSRVSRSNEQRGTPVLAWPGSDGVTARGDRFVAAVFWIALVVGVLSATGLVAMCVVKP